MRGRLCARGDHVNHDPLERKLNRTRSELRRALDRYEGFRCPQPAPEELPVLWARVRELTDELERLLVAFDEWQRERRKGLLIRRAMLN